MMTTLLFAAVLCSSAGLRVASVFGDGMVLQGGRSIRVWGSAKPGADVTVEFAEVAKTARSEQDGRWSVELPAQPASKIGRTLVVKGGEESKTINDVLVGEVWIASGQSNMECPLWCSQEHRRDMDGALVAQMTVRPHVRIAKVGRATARDPQSETARPVQWTKVVPAAMKIDGGWLPSAIGYFFGVGLSDELDVPVGIVDITWGGTDIDAWTPPSGYEGKDGFARERNWRYLSDREWDDEKQKHGPCGGAIQQPRVLWNGMVAPFVKMAIRGVIWYQGCQNMHDPTRYAAKMHALYDGWATEFGMPDMPFVFAQLAPFGDQRVVAIQEAQEKFAREERRAALVTTCDHGNENDCHPAEKSAVARRFLAQALARCYGRTWLKADPPWVREAHVEGDVVVLSFENVRGFYQYHPDWSVESGFEICGKDGVWHKGAIKNLAEPKRTPYKSQGRITGMKLHVFSPEVKDPKAIRYLHSAPWYGSVKNEMSLPMGPFHIDFGADLEKGKIK